jgi:predicted nucleic acid-binding protein
VILLDTTILVYAVGDDHRLREPCRTLIGAIGEGRIAATATVETIQEFTHVRARRRTRTDAATLARRYVELLTPLTVVEGADLARGLDLFEQHDPLGAFDAVLAAVVEQRPHLSALASADVAFTDLDGIDHVDPADPAFLERAARADA